MAKNYADRKKIQNNINMFKLTVGQLLNIAMAALDRDILSAWTENIKTKKADNVIINRNVSYKKAKTEYDLVLIN